MIYDVTKFKAHGKEWDYIVDFERANGESGDREGMTLKSNTTPKGALTKKAGEVARLALLFHGLGLIVEHTDKTILNAQVSKLTGEKDIHAELFGQIGFAFSSISWTGGDEPGSRVEVILTSAKKLADSTQTAQTKLMLSKVDTRDEMALVGEGKDKRLVHVEGSLKDAYNAAVKELRDFVKAYADGESAQGQLFERTEAAS
jgi:hypothetical protein